MTGILDRLECAGYAWRKPDPTDRRSVVMQPRHLTEMQKRVGPIFQSRLNEIATIASQYTTT
jgi:hypothetical protein